MSPESKRLLKNLPKVDKILEDSRISALIGIHPRSMVVDEIRQYLEELRGMAATGTLSEIPDCDSIAGEIASRTELKLNPGLRRCVNGVGIVLHTSLGRAPLAEAAQKALAEAIKGYCTLAVSCETGKRGDRSLHVEKLLKKITGAEAACVVNNNAAATLLVLNTLAEGKEVLISRGELIEIGGSFRIPDVMKRSGAKLVEVGTTNRTHLKDYKNAITPDTAIILKVHQSNYRIVGFTSQVPIGELAELAHQNNIRVFDDIGSGALVDLTRWGLPKEPLAQESIAAGSDAVCFSGDKILGGPQCGIVLGKKEVIDEIKSNPLARALRCDKMIFAVLEATLRLFLDEKKLLSNHPVLRLLTMPPDEIRLRCDRLGREIARIIGDRGTAVIEEDESEAGSGSLAAVGLPTWVVAVSLHNVSADQIALNMRTARIPVFGRVKDQKYVLDGRTIGDDELQFVVEGFKELLEKL